MSKVRACTVDVIGEIHILIAFHYNGEISKCIQYNCLLDETGTFDVMQQHTCTDQLTPFQEVAFSSGMFEAILTSIHHLI